MLNEVAKLALFLNHEKRFNTICVGNNKDARNVGRLIKKEWSDCKVLVQSEGEFIRKNRTVSVKDDIVIYFLSGKKHLINKSKFKYYTYASQNYPFIVYVESEKKDIIKAYLSKFRGYFIETESLNKFLNKISLKGFIKTKNQNTRSRIYIDGIYANFRKIENNLTVLAIITLYNESDIIERNVKYLVKQGIDVHIIDNWSTDGSYKKVKKLTTLYKGLTLERFPTTKAPRYYEWKKILTYIENIAHNSKHDWIIHYDSDEFREAPWPETSLYEGIKFVDSLGFNILDFTVLNYRFTKSTNNFSSKVDPLKYFKYCEFANHPAHFIQVKAWKNTNQKVKLAKSGGHDVDFKGKHSFPLKFLINHYPLRSSKQARKKLFEDRFPRFSPKEVKSGWHSHYNKYKQTKHIIFNEDKLIQGRTKTFNENYLLERISTIGIEREV